MPEVEAPAVSIFPRIGDIMDGARARVNDMMNSTEGDILTNDAPFAQTFLTLAWDWLQNLCDVNGVELGIGDEVFFSIPARAVDDTANPAYINQFGCSDGLNQFEQPRLPANIINPRFVWRRRANGIGTLGTEFWPMRQAENGLPVCLDSNVYDWRGNAIYFYGDTQAQDFRIRSSTYLPPLDITKPNDPVQMMGCKDCMVARVAYEYASARGAAQAPDMKAWSESAFNDVIANRTARRKQAKTVRRQPYGGRRHFGRFVPQPRNF